MQTNLFDLHCRGATGYVAKPNIIEAESFPEAPPDMWPQAKYHRSVKEKSRRDRDWESLPLTEW